MTPDVISDGIRDYIGAAPPNSKYITGNRGGKKMNILIQGEHINKAVADR